MQRRIVENFLTFYKLFWESVPILKMIILYIFLEGYTFDADTQTKAHPEGN